MEYISIEKLKQARGFIQAILAVYTYGIVILVITVLLTSRFCIGNSNDDNQSFAPRIGNNVWIGAHSKIHSGVTLEDDTTISAGSTIKKGAHIASGSLVIGNPARTIRKNYDNSFLL